MQMGYEYLLVCYSALCLSHFGLQLLQACFQDLHLSFQLLLALSTLSKEFDDVLLLMLGTWHNLQRSTGRRTPRRCP